MPLHLPHPHLHVPDAVARHHWLLVAVVAVALGVAVTLLRAADLTPSTTAPTGRSTVVGASSGAVRFVAVGGVDQGNTCLSAARPCGSLGGAYRAAAPGDRVQVAAGTYPEQRIDFDPAKTDPAHVVIGPAPGAAVTTGDLLIKAAHLTVESLRVRDVALNVNTEITTMRDITARDITLRNLDGRNFEDISASQVRIEGGDWGPASACGGPDGGGNNAIRQYPGGPQPTNIVIDGARIHGIRSFDLAACHTEGLAIFAGRGVTVSRSRFYDNDVYDVFVQVNSGADPISQLTLENNWFAATTRQGGVGRGYSSGEIDGPSNGVHVRHNSFDQALVISSPGPFTDTDISGNLGPLPEPGCALPGARFAYNVWQSGTCSPTDLSLRGGRLPYVDGSDGPALDYHLTGGRAVDHVPPAALTVAVDIDGQPRPIGRGGDAGSDEVARDGAVGAVVRAPVTRFVRGPCGPARGPTARTRCRRAPPTARRPAVFVFTSNVAGARYDCRLDRGPWRRCRSPRRLTSLASGRHVFAVRASGRTGRRDRTPALYAWRVG